jgi:hypothetical protein
MDKKGEIPCSSCDSWKKKEKKFSCNPDSCPELTAWLRKNAPQLNPDAVQLQVNLPEIAFQYIV